jgi:hypothetical protein
MNDSWNALFTMAERKRFFHNHDNVDARTLWIIVLADGIDIARTTHSRTSPKRSIPVGFEAAIT